MTRNLPDTRLKGTKGKIEEEGSGRGERRGTYEVRGSDTLAAYDRRIAFLLQERRVRGGCKGYE